MNRYMVLFNTFTNPSQTHQSKTVKTIIYEVTYHKSDTCHAPCLLFGTDCLSYTRVWMKTRTTSRSKVRLNRKMDRNQKMAVGTVGKE